MKKMINKSHVEGLLYECTLEEKTSTDETGKTKTYIAGKVSVEVSEDNVVTVDLFESAITKAGAGNKKYPAVKGLIAAPSILSGGRETAVKVRIDSAIDLNDWYRPDGELISSLRNFGGFIHVIADNKFTPAATFETDILITSTQDDMSKSEDGILEPNGNLVVNGLIFNYANAVMPVKLVVENEAGVKFFQSMEQNTFTKVWGNMVTQEIKTSKVEESAFGDDKVVEYTNTRKKYIITGTNKESYMFGDENVLTVQEVQTALANRNVKLAEAKARSERNDNKPAQGAKTGAAINPATATFNF